MVALDLWDHLGRRVTPMLAVYATATVVVTVAAGTRCACYGLTGPLDAEQSGIGGCRRGSCRTKTLPPLKRYPEPHG